MANPRAQQRAPKKSSQASGGLSEAVVESAQILNVNAADYSVDFATDTSHRRFFDVPVGAPYTNYIGGEGMYIMPEVGATCWICWPSDGKHPFVLAYGPPVNEAGNWRGNRVDLSPGDIYMGTRDRNAVIIRRGGVVQVMASPLAQRYYIPVNNLIRDFCQNYELRTFGGDLTWLVDRAENDEDGDQKTTLHVKAKQSTEDPQAVCEMTLGDHGDDTYFQLQVFDSGADGHSRVGSLTVDKQGKVTWDIDDDFVLTTKKSVTMTADENVSLQAKKSLSLKATDGVVLECAEGEIIIRSPKANVRLGDSGLVVTPSGQVTLGSGTPGSGQPGVLGTEMLRVHATHTHPLVIGGLPYTTSVPMQAATSILAKKTRLN